MRDLTCMGHDDGYCELHGFKTIGQASTENGLLAVVAPYFAHTLGQWWHDYLEQNDHTRPQLSMENSHEITLEQTTYKQSCPDGYQDTQWALLVNCDNDIYDVEARFCDQYGDGHMSICELRIKLHRWHHDDGLDDEVEDD